MSTPVQSSSRHFSGRCSTTNRSGIPSRSLPRYSELSKLNSPQLRCVLMMGVYQKTLSSRRSKSDSAGRTINLYSADSQLIFQSIQYIPTGLMAPIQLLGTIGIIRLRCSARFRNLQDAPSHLLDICCPNVNSDPFAELFAASHFRYYRFDDSPRWCVLPDCPRAPHHRLPHHLEARSPGRLPAPRFAGICRSSP